MGNVRALLSLNERVLINKYMTNGSVYMWHDPEDTLDGHALTPGEVETADGLAKRGLLWKGGNENEPGVTYYTQTPQCFDQIVDGYTYGVTEGGERRIVKRDFTSAQQAYDYARVFQGVAKDEVNVVLLGFSEEPPDPKQEFAEHCDILWPVDGEPESDQAGNQD